MKNYQGGFSSTSIRTLMIAVMAMLTCHVTQAAMANFNDSTQWRQATDGSGVQLNNVNNGSGFQVNFAADAQTGADGNMAAGYESTFTLQGNFVIELNYSLNFWPPSPPPNGVRLAISLGPFLGSIRESTIYTSGDGYTFEAGGYTYVPTADQSGSLIMARMGDTISGYYWSAVDAAWVLVGSASGYSRDFPIWVSSWSDWGFCHQPVSVTLSDLQISTGADAIIPGPVIPAPIIPGGDPAVPEPSTCLAGALLLLPFGASLIRKLRKA
jgi:hypothetical protein